MVAMPQVAAMTPNGSSQARALRSERYPKTGWISDDDRFATSTNVPIMV